MSEREAVIPAKDLRDTSIPDDEFLTLIQNRQDITETKKIAEAELKEINEQIMAHMVDAGEKAVLVDDWRVTFVQSSTSTINKQRLLELGVSAKIIKKATKVTPKEYVQVTAAKE